VTAAAPRIVGGQAAPGGQSAGVSGGFVGGVTSGSAGRGSFTMTESRNGVTVQYSDAGSARVPVTVNGADVQGLQMVVSSAQ
jgi:hypothetical protein